MASSEILVQNIFLVSTFLLLVIGFYFEGIRVHQFPFITGILINGVVSLFTQAPITLAFIGVLLTLFSTILLVLFGETDFMKMVNHGPYQVGFKEFRTQKYDNAISVFYPISKDHHKAMISLNDTKWLRDGDKTLEGIARASSKYGSEDHPSLHIFRYLRNVTMNTVFNGDID